MSHIAVVTDSTAYLASTLTNQHNIHVVPQILIWGNDTYLDGVDILPDEFYRRLKTAKILPTTSQVPIVTMKNTFEELLGMGYEILGLFISSKLSGTMHSAIQAREMLPKAAAKIALVDSLSTSMAMGFQVLAAARLAETGASLMECQRLAIEAQHKTGVYFVVDTLEFLHKGGRIGGAQAFLGSALNIKPLLSIVDGTIEPVEKIRTKTKALHRMVELFASKTSGRLPIRLAILHANASVEARKVAEEAIRLTNPIESHLTSVSPVIGAHSGPGTVGLAYMVDL